MFPCRRLWRLYCLLAIVVAAPLGGAETPAASFQKLDTNRDGILSGRESLGIRELDRNNDGEITADEYAQGRERTGLLKSAGDPGEVFRKLDENGDDLLSGREKKGVEAFDLNGDAEITLAEFTKGRNQGLDAKKATESPVAPSPDAAAPQKDRKSSAWDDQLRKQFDTGRKWALLIGVKGYKKDPLRYTAADARLLAETLVKHGGYAAERVVLMTDDQPEAALQPTKANIEEQLARFLSYPDANDTVVVSFMGHGLHAAGQTFLCPLDFEPDPDMGVRTAWRADELRTLLQDCKAAQKILILDSCHSGGAITSAGFGATPQQVGSAFATAQGLITLAACRTNQQSLESKETGHGVFTYSLCGGLAGEADADGNGTVDSDEIYKHVLAEVPAAARKVIAGHNQTPVRIIGQDVVGVFALARGERGLGDQLPGARRLRPGETFENSIGMKFVALAPGVYGRGSPRNERGRSDDENLHPVVLSQKFGLGVYEVTQAEYARVMGANPSYYSPGGAGRAEVADLDTSRFPVEQVSWDDAQAFCRRLQQMPAEQAAGRIYRLPTEAEWEYACRAATTTPFATGETITSQDANLRGDRPYGLSPVSGALGRSTTVGMYRANRFGLHDMHGNVAEWCLDLHDSYRVAYGEFAAEDVLNAIEQFDKAADQQPLDLRPMTDPISRVGPAYIYRGGSFQNDGVLCRSAARRSRERDYRSRTVGFRVVCMPVP